MAGPGRPVLTERTKSRVTGIPVLRLLCLRLGFLFASPALALWERLRGEGRGKLQKLFLFGGADFAEVADDLPFPFGKLKNIGLVDFQAGIAGFFCLGGEGFQQQAHVHMEDIRQVQQRREVGVGFAGFVVGIGGAVDTQGIRDLLLREPAFFPEQPQAFANFHIIFHSFYNYKI